MDILEAKNKYLWRDEKIIIHSRILFCGSLISDNFHDIHSCLSHERQSLFHIVGTKPIPIHENVKYLCCGGKYVFRSSRFVSGLQISCCQWFEPNGTLSHGWLSRGRRSGYLNSSTPCTTYMRHWIGSTLVQKMACGLFGAKPLSKPMLSYCQWDP